MMTTQERNKWVKNLQTWEHLYVPFSMATKLPFIVCDEESYNDQAHLFADKEEVVRFAGPFLEKKYMISGVEISVEQRLRFLLDLVTVGVNTIVIHGQEETVELELSEVIRVEDDKNLPEDQKPLLNPQLQMSGIYFMQEIRRPETDLEDPKLKELEEEVSANAVRAQYLMPVDVTEEELPDGEKKKKGLRFPYLEDKEKHMLQPLFTDGAELQKFLKGRKMQILKIPFAGLPQYASKESYGFAINPLGINLIIRKEQIPAMIRRFE